MLELQHDSSLQSILQKEKNGIGKAEGWDTQWHRLASTAIAETVRKQVCSHGPFPSLLNHSNGNPQIEPQEDMGNQQLNLFPVCFTSLSCSNHCKQLTVNQFRITEKHEVWRRQINKVGYASWNNTAHMVNAAFSAYSERVAEKIRIIFNPSYNLSAA